LSTAKRKIGNERLLVSTAPARSIGVFDLDSDALAVVVNAQNTRYSWANVIHSRVAGAHAFGAHDKSVERPPCLPAIKLEKFYGALPAIDAAMCRRELVIEATSRDAQAIVGEECHIISRKTEGPRYDQDYAAEKIDEVENLILLCAVHHKMVDDQSETYTAEILRKLKANHEAWVRTSLADEKGVPPLKLRRLKENIPSHLLRLTNGRDVLKIVDQA
jgi:hypothetical protein